MSLPEVFDKLHPALKEDPTDMSFLAMLKTVFDSKNITELNTEDTWDILSALSKQSKYEETPNIFFSPEFKKKGKAARIEAFKEYYSFIKGKITHIIEDDKASLYCLECMRKTSDEDNGLLGWIGPKEYSYEPGNKLCDNFEGFKNLKSINIKGFDFIGNQSLGLNVVGDKDHFIISTDKPIANIDTGMVVKTEKINLNKLLKSWYKTVFQTEIPIINKETKLNTYRIEVVDIKPEIIPSPPEVNVIYDRGMLKKDTGAISKEVRKIFVEKSKNLSIQEKEDKIVKWASKDLDVVDYSHLKNVYFPEMDHEDILLMSMQEKLYKPALERVVKDAKKGRLDLSLV